MLRRLSAAFLVLAFLSGAQLGCDSKSKSKSKSSESDEDDDAKKKDKGDKTDGAATGSAKLADKPAGLEVVSIPGFVVPVGGKYEHQKIELGEKVLEFENYTYPVKDFDRPTLHKSFKDGLTSAGWVVTPEAGSETKFTVTKGTISVDVLFGEASADETKINVMSPKTVAGTALAPVGEPAAVPAGGAVVFAGSYSSIWGPVTLEQSKATPDKVTGKYAKGTVSCTATDKKLDCTWAERGAQGRAVFSKDDKGDLPGTWGSGGSSTNGGGWNLKLTKAAELN